MSLEDVAKRARVSSATVSRVLNNLDVVKSSTRARVMKAVAELNYHPNLHARTLAGGQSRTLGIVVSNMENPFFFDVFQSLESDAHAHGYEVVAANTGYEPERLVSSIRLMMGRRVAGLAVIVSEMDSALKTELAEGDMPVVFYDVGAPGKKSTNIRVQYRKGIEKIVQYLHNLGHTRMAFIGHHAKLAPLDERKKAFLETVARYSPHLEITSEADADGPEGGRKAARQLLASGFMPTAIICVNDFTAIGVLRELRDQGVRVPEDISVTGFDNIKLSEFCFPALTTVHIPRERIGHSVFASLVPNANGGAEPSREILIDPEFLVRDSTGVAREA
ncbi:MAG TPA: LacI family DNA-binding transcriptional regulator [Bryobacteraceae bacterium]|jgi:DNA-binding LacI/PurR family transcriptional regulator